MSSASESAVSDVGNERRKVYLVATPHEAIRNYRKMAEIGTDLQRLAGVDPEKCMKISTWPSRQRLPLELYFDEIGNGRFPVVEGGEWGEHDTKLHVWPVLKLHPVNVDLVKNVAPAGTAALAHGDVDAAEQIGRRLDYFLSTLCRYTPYDFEKLAPFVNTPFNAVELATVQAQHNEALSRARVIRSGQAIMAAV